MTLAEFWREKTDDEVLAAGRHLSDYTEEAQRVIRDEIARRRASAAPALADRRPDEFRGPMREAPPGSLCTDDTKALHVCKKCGKSVRFLEFGNDRLCRSCRLRDPIHRAKLIRMFRSVSAVLAALMLVFSPGAWFFWRELTGNVTHPGDALVLSVDTEDRFPEGTVYADREGFFAIDASSVPLDQMPPWRAIPNDQRVRKDRLRAFSYGLNVPYERGKLFVEVLIPSLAFSSRAWFAGVLIVPASAARLVGAGFAYEIVDVRSMRFNIVVHSRDGWHRYAKGIAVTLQILALALVLSLLFWAILFAELRKMNKLNSSG